MLTLIRRMKSLINSNVAKSTFDDVSVHLTDWYRTRPGKALLKAQMKQLDQLTTQCFGFHAVQLTPVRFKLPLQELRITHRLSIHPDRSVHPDIQADFEELPLSGQSIDFLLMHHALDYSADPHTMLREVERVMVSKGYIAIVGFNPWSLWGIYSYFARFFSNNPVYRTTRIRRGRLLDWLKLLDLTPVNIQHASFITPMPNVSMGTQLQYAPTNESSAGILRWRATYIVLARKDTQALIPIKPIWRFKKQAMGWAMTRGCVQSNHSQADARSNLRTKKRLTD